MKTQLQITKKLLIAIIAFTITTGLTNAQSRYNHVPRVKVDVSKIEKTTIKKESKKHNSIVIIVSNTSEENTTTNISDIYTEDKSTEVASTTNEIIMPIIKTKAVIKQPKVLKENKKVYSHVFTKRVKENSKLMDVKDAKKTNSLVVTLLLIAFYVLAFIFILIAVLMLLLIIPFTYSIFLLFLILGITFALAATVLITLLKFGLIN